MNPSSRSEQEAEPRTRSCCSMREAPLPCCSAPQTEKLLDLPRSLDDGNSKWYGLAISQAYWPCKCWDERLTAIPYASHFYFCIETNLLLTPLFPKEGPIFFTVVWGWDMKLSTPFVPLWHTLASYRHPFRYWPAETCWGWLSKPPIYSPLFAMWWVVMVIHWTRVILQVRCPNYNFLMFFVLAMTKWYHTLVLNSNVIVIVYMEISVV
jgi:hypothetical protein